MSCIFCKIVKGEMPSYKIYEDNDVIVVLDIFPATKGHALIIPKEHYENVFDIPEDLLSKVIKVAKKIATAAKEALNAEGVNILMNNGRVSGQVIMHAHVHVIPRYANDGIKFSLNQKEADKKELEEIVTRYREKLSSM